MRYSNANATDRVQFLLASPTFWLDSGQCLHVMLTALLFPGDQQVKSEWSWGSVIAGDEKTSQAFQTSTEEDQLPLFIYCYWRGNVKQAWAPCRRAMPNPGDCCPLREGWCGFVPRKHLYSIQLWKKKYSEKPWNTQQGTAEIFLCNWVPSQNIMSQYGMGVSPEECTYASI